MKASVSRIILRTLMCVIAAIGSDQGLRAQSVYGSVLGTITDATGAVIAGARFTLTNTGRNEERQTQSDTKGNYQFVNLQPGTYSISVDQPGFKRFRRSSITVEVQSAVRIDVSLQVGESSQSIEVTEQTPLLQTQTATMGQVVDSKQVEEMPLNGRNPINLAALDPAVVPQGGTTGSAAQAGVNGIGNYQIGGGTANQSAAYLDGAPINISYVNSTALIPIQDSIQEFRVATNNVSPEFGRFAGGVLNMSTKSGTNQLHGVLYEYIRNTDFNANTFFLNKAGKPAPRSPKTSTARRSAVRSARTGRSISSTGSRPTCGWERPRLLRFQLRRNEKAIFRRRGCQPFSIRQPPAERPIMPRARRIRAETQFSAGHP